MTNPSFPMQHDVRSKASTTVAPKHIDWSFLEHVVVETPPISVDSLIYPTHVTCGYQMVGKHRLGILRYILKGSNDLEPFLYSTTPKTQTLIGPGTSKNESRPIQAYKNHSPLLICVDAFVGQYYLVLCNPLFILSPLNS